MTSSMNLKRCLEMIRNIFIMINSSMNKLSEFGISGDKLKIFLICALILAIFSPISAKIQVKDAESGQPLPKASVFDNKGLFIGVADDNGILPPTIAESAYPINIRYVGYQPVDVATPDVGEVNLYESTYVLPELVVDDKSRNLLYLQVFVREYTTGEDSNDTLGQYKEQIVDYVFPVAKKTKFKGWKKPRILATKNYKQIKKERKKQSVDTLTYNEEKSKYTSDFSLTDKFVVPDPILSGEVKEYVVEGKYSPEEKWYVIGDNYIVEKDELSDYENHIYQPSILKLFGASMAQTTNESRYKFDIGEKAPSIENLVEVTQQWDIILKGKLFKKMTEANDDTKLNHYSEMFVIDRAYLTAEEAKELKDNPPVISSKFQLPEGIPEPPAEIQKLKEDVEKAR